VFLTVGVAIRAWWLTIAFEPAKGADAYFRPYFLLPLVLAWGVLVLEMGLARRSTGAIAAGLILPLIGLFIGFPGGGQSAVEVDFLNRLVATIGSPPQLAVGGLLLFYAWAWSRQVRASEGFLIVLGLLFSIVGRETLDWSSLVAPQPLIVAVVATALLIQAVRLDSTWRAIAGGRSFQRDCQRPRRAWGCEPLVLAQRHAPLAALWPPARSSTIGWRKSCAKSLAARRRRALAAATPIRGRCRGLIRRCYSAISRWCWSSAARYA
jgi:hypothetical protein